MRDKIDVFITSVEKEEFKKAHSKSSKDAKYAWRVRLVVENVEGLELKWVERNE